MFLDRKPLLYLWRPTYRVIIVGIVWPVLQRIKQVLFSDLDGMSDRICAVQSAQEQLRRDLDMIARQMSAVQASLIDQQAVIQASLHQQQRIATEVSAMESEHRKCWLATQSLLLSMFSTPSGQREGPISLRIEHSPSGVARAKATTSAT